MSRRKRYRGSEDDPGFPLPWPIELVFWIIGLICVPIGMWWITNEVTSPATLFGQMLGVEVKTKALVEPFMPMIVIFGLIVGWRVRCWLRRRVINKLEQVL